MKVVYIIIIYVVIYFQYIFIVISYYINHTAWANAASLEILPYGEVQSKPSGSNLFLTCKLTGVNDPSLGNIQWLDPYNRVIELRNSFTSNDKTGNPIVYTEKKPEDNSLSLYFNPLREDQTGQYTCLGNYALTETFNKTVKVQTIDAITWVDAPETQHAIVGKEYKIKCQVSARPAPTVDWYLGSKSILTDDHYIVETHALKIKSVSDDDAGTYICRAAVLETGELEERYIKLIVYEEPKLQEVSSEIEIIEGKTASITVCNATGKPPPAYSWIKTINQENLTTVNRFGVDRDTGVLTITDVRREDSGEYQCIAENPAASANINIRVNVIEKPKIMEFINRTQAVQKDVEITCKAYGRPPPVVVFKKQTNDKPFSKGIQSNDDRIELTSIENVANGETVAVLSIRRVLREDDGIYECIATNKVGSSYKNGHLTVEFPPSFASMTNHSVWSWERRPVNLTCIAESIPNATIQWYHGERPILQTELATSEIYRQYGNGPISTLRVTPVDTRYYGHYRCQAKNVHGEAIHTIQLKEGKRPDTIPQARMSEITATTIAFNIEPPSMEPELPVKTITVQYREVNQPWKDALNKTWALNSPYILEHLKPATTYLFRFLATNDVGPGNWGAQFEENTPMRTVPNSPKFQPRTDNPNYDTSLYSNQYEINWITPPDNGEPIDKYEIHYCEIKRVNGEWEQQDNTCVRDEIKGQRSKHYIKNLNADTYYRVELRAHNVIGFGKTEVIQFKTAKAQSTPVLHQGPLISSAAIIGIIIAILILMLVLIDLICCCTHRAGIIFYVCERSRRKPIDEEDAKLGSLYGWRFPLPYCDQKMANVAGVTAIQDSGSGKSTIKLVKHSSIEEKEPLKEEKKITPIIDSGLRRETSITFDGKRSISKTGFVGKDSAV
ncbi:fasciclin-2 isoform X2 [Microplitis mediator]|uniref:fasciclin-2 isoform X2 n=1 Tax=Microplitis mediator TaxID=375433 RepID=UPI0025577CDF|nr:fasciclin-2 isoform X2 [Microplitis mediator]